MSNESHALSSSEPAAIPRGLQAIHANQLEDLRHAVVWLSRRYPLAPLDDEVFLVQSNGIAQWLKLALAEQADDDGGGCGISAGNSFLLPHRFVWQAYRAVLGHEGVPESSPFDKDRLVWQLFALLPQLAVDDQLLYAPLLRFMDGPRPEQRRFQLAQKLADLFDQYQVFRADWLAAWADGSDDLIPARGEPRPLPSEQRWQPALWRNLVARIGRKPATTAAAADQLSRASIHQRFLEVGKSLDSDAPPAGLPRRIVVFGVSSLPQQTLEVLDVIGRWSQVVLCVHNPCRYYWADIISDRDLLMASRRRAGRKQGMPANLEDADLHQHAQPLLAAWGKQGRDYIRLLDSFDDPESYRSSFQNAGQRVDIFQAPEGPKLLQQLQNDICELRPLAETRNHWPPVDTASDSSIVFHIAHSPLRELEILHDQLLAAFNADAALKPRDIIVMVPDINTYAPAIQAVFGRHHGQDANCIPFTISDQGLRHRQPIAVALELLLSLPESRFNASEILSILEIEAVRARFDIEAEELPLLASWIAGANICWGLNAAQRSSLGLPQNLEGNTWRFGLERMVLGYATGESPAWEGIEPFPEVAGLEAELAGRLAQFVNSLEALLATLSEARSPASWADTLTMLQHDFLLVDSQADLMVQEKLQDVVEQWLAACGEAGLADSEQLPLTIVRELVMEGLEDRGLNQRFLAGRVNFATLMPMRAIPFRHVCLLGMSDGEYPRSRPPVDFDLMATDYRPGDRSRREDDRYLFLEALLSARDRLYISWVGRSIRDNSGRPPSVLVAQLRDHLEAGWHLSEGSPDSREAAPESLVAALTLEHPLQAFSADYHPPLVAPPTSAAGFSELVNSRSLFTFDKSWRGGEKIAERSPEPLLLAPLQDKVISLAELASFLNKPVAHFYRNRLGLRFEEDEGAIADHEMFELAGLDLWHLRSRVISDVMRSETIPDAHDNFFRRMEASIERMAGKGDLGLQSSIDVLAGKVTEPMESLFENYSVGQAKWPERSEERVRIQAQTADGAIILDDSIDDLSCNDAGELCQIVLLDVDLIRKRKGYNFWQMIGPWVRHVAANAVQDGPELTTVVFSPAGQIEFEPVQTQQAAEYLDAMLAAYAIGSQRPLPLERKTGFAALSRHTDEAGVSSPQIDLDAARAAYDDVLAYGDPYLARAWPDFEHLNTGAEFEALATSLYWPLWDRVKVAKNSAGKNKRAQ